MKDLVFSTKKYLLIFLQLQKINIMKRAAYPWSFFSSTLTVFLMMFLNVFFIKISFSYVDSVAGWNFYQILAVLGSYMIVEGVMWVFFGQLNSINGHIREGTFDSIMLKPIDDQFLASLWRGDWEDFVRIITGGALLALSVRNTAGFDFLHLMLFLLTLFCGITMLYSFNIALRAVSFWIIDGSGLWILMERVTANSQFPVDIYYNKIVRGLFTFIIPLAFVATIPAKTLTDVAIDFKLVALSFFMAIIFFVISRKFWKFSLGHYSSASS